VGECCEGSTQTPRAESIVRDVALVDHPAEQRIDNL
jgi:hypothetical protein